MATFDFGGIKNTSALGSNSLKPWGIYDVTFKGLSIEDLKGKKDPDATYKTVKLEFVGKSGGSFTKNLFIPSTEQDAERKENENADGHKYELPSRFEQFKWTLLQLVQSLNPEGFKKIQEMSDKDRIKSMSDFLKLVIAEANAKKGVETKLKLTGRTSENGATYADIPNVVNISKEGNLYVSNRFVGDNVEFTLYEAGKAKAYHAAKPTNTEEEIKKGQSAESTDSANDDLNSIDFESL